MAQSSEAQLQSVLGMLRGIDEIIESTESWPLADLRKIGSKIKAVTTNIERKIEVQEEAPKQSMSYDNLVQTITVLIR